MKIGIDKAVISLHLKANTINLNALKEDGAVIVTDNNAPYTIYTDTTSGRTVRVNYIKLSRSENERIIFNSLMIGCNKNQYKQWVSYAKVDVTIPALKGSTNRENITDSKELKEILGILKSKLNEYGLEVDMEQSVLQELEINNNIPLKLKFKDYEYICEYLKSLVSPTLKTVINQSYGVNSLEGAYTGFKIGNNSRNLKYYDKRKALYKVYGIDIQEELMRIEYRFRNGNTIKNYLGYNKVGELIEDELENVCKAYREMFIKDIYNPLKQDINKQLRAIEQELKASKRINIKSIISQKPLDVLLVLNALKKINKGGNNARDSKRCIDLMCMAQIQSSKLVGINQDYYFNNLEKINEILKAMNLELIEIEISKTVQKKLEDTVKKLEEIQGN